MPVYNAGPYLVAAIDSIIRQSYSKFEFIICDDASEDSSSHILESLSDPRIKLLKNDVNKGYLHTCNDLLAKAKGDFITFQDADDKSLSNRLELQLKEFKKDPELGICGTWAEIVNEKGEFIRINKRAVSPLEIKSRIQFENVFLGASIMIRKEVYYKIGGYRLFFDRLGYQDYDWTYLIIENYKGRNIPKPLYQYRQHIGSTSSQVDIMRHVSFYLVQFLGDQRKKYGKDALQNNEYAEELFLYIEQLKAPYIKDESYIYRDLASVYMYKNLRIAAIHASLKAIKIKPFYFINYRTLFYCVRKSVV